MSRMNMADGQGALRGLLRRWRWPVGTAVVLACYALAGFVLAPWLVERELPRVVQEALGREATVAGVAVNPFLLTLRIEGFRLADTDGSTLAGFDALFLDFEVLASLVARAPTLAALRIDAPYLDVVRGRDGAVNLLELVPPEPAAPDTAPAGLPRFVVRELRLNRGLIDVTDAMPETPFRTQVGPFDVALDELSTLPDAAGRHQLAIGLESGTRVTVAGELVVNPLHASGDVTMTGPFLGLLHRYVRDQFAFDIAGGSSEIGLHFDLRGTTGGAVEASVTDLAATVRDVRLDAHTAPGFLGWSELRLTGGTLRWPAQEVDVQAVALTGLKVRARLDADGRIDVEQFFAPPTGNGPAAVSTPAAAHELAAAPTTATAPATGNGAAPWSVRVAEAALSDATIEFTDAARAQPVTHTIADLDVTLREVSTEPGARMPLEAGVRLGAGGDIRVAGTLAVLPDVVLDAEVKAVDIALDQAQPYVSDIARVEIRGGTLSLDGHLGSDSREQLAFDGDLRIHDLDTYDLGKEEKLLAWRELGLDDMQLRLDGNQARITRVRIERPFSRVFIARDQTTNIGDLLVEETAAGPVAGTAPAPAPAGPAAPAFRTRIGAVRIRDGEVDFTDLSLPLPFAARVQQLQGEFTTIDTRSVAPSRIRLEGRVAEYGHARVDGEVRVSSPTDLADVAVVFRNIEMAPLSPYVVKFAGRKIASGRIDLDLRYQLHDRQMVGTNKIVIDQLELGEKVPNPDAVDLPLGLAVALLKDANGRIDIDMPVSGSLDDPEFGIGSVLWKAFVNLVTKVAAAPFRLLGGLLGIESEDLGRIDFLPGRADLLPPEQEKLLRVAEGLARRPALTVAVPAVVDPAADMVVLRTAKLDALVEQELAASGAPGSGRGLERRTRQVIESLYERSFPDRSLDELQAGFQAPPPDDPQGRSRLDELAYLGRLRTDLAGVQPVGAEELDALGTARAAAIVTALTAGGTIDAARVQAGERREVEARGGEWISVELGVGGVE